MIRVVWFSAASAPNGPQEWALPKGDGDFGEHPGAENGIEDEKETRIATVAIAKERVWFFRRFGSFLVSVRERTLRSLRVDRAIKFFLK